MRVNHVPSLKFVGFPFGRYFADSVCALIGLEILTVDLSTSKWSHYCHYTSLAYNRCIYLPVFGTHRNILYWCCHTANHFTFYAAAAAMFEFADCSLLLNFCSPTHDVTTKQLLAFR